MLFGEGLKSYWEAVPELGLGFGLRVCCVEILAGELRDEDVYA